jgi:AraC-like DNA-binding protein
MQKRKHSSSSYARILFRHLRLSEENSTAFFAGTNVAYEELMTLDGTLSRQASRRIYRNALAISERDDLGLSVGAQLRLSTHGPLGVATSSGPDLRTGMYLLARFGQTRTDFFDYSISEEADGIKLSFTETFDLADLRAFITESTLSGVFSAITFFIDIERFDGKVNFAYAKPLYWKKYRKHFGNNLEFDHKVTEVIIPDAVLSLPSPTADPVMHREAIAMCERHLQDMQADLSEAAVLSTTETVTKLISDNPGKIWTLAEVAAKMHMSGRTLIRRLADEETKFQTLRDGLAKEQAAKYLSDGNLSVESVGYLMGFSDSSSFRRSFKRWFGKTPSEYMRRARST